MPLTTARYLTFEGSSRISLSKPRKLAFSADDQVLVKSLFSAISFGTESKLYHGTWPEGLALDASLAGMEQPVSYPVAYGYATLGRVIRSAAKENKGLEGELVFCFRPHGSHHIVPCRDLITVPALNDQRNALFIPNLETAVSLVMDTAPLIAETVAVVGLGVVGQLVSSVLSRFPLARLIAIDTDAFRIGLCVKRLGAYQHQHRPAELITGKEASAFMGEADAVIEVSGSRKGLKAATELVRRSGRITLGSLFGDDEQAMTFGSQFHRSQARLICSQVSRIDPQLAGRFTKERRMDYVLALLPELEPELAPLITHTVAFEDASCAYEMLATGAAGCCQVLLQYE